MADFKAGKTTATGKLGLYLKDKDKKVLFVAADIYRPAAVDQLQTPEINMT